MSARTLLPLVLLLIVPACRIADPVVVTPQLEATAALAEVNPADIAILPLEDGTAEQSAARHLDFMRQSLAKALTDRRYSPLNTQMVDATLAENPGAIGSATLLAPAVLKSLAGTFTDDATLAVKVVRWDESRLMKDNRVQFQLEAALVAAQGENLAILWRGILIGDVKAGGEGAAPLDPEIRAQSCAAIAMQQLIQRLPMRQP